jgi:phosphate-selective porin OprO and OprP
LPRYALSPAETTILMNAAPQLLLAAAFATAAPLAHAEIRLDTLGAMKISFEGMLQADGNWFDDDVVDLNGTDGDSETELRRAELILKGKAERFDWVVGYDAKADKFLDSNLRWKLGSGYLLGGQYKQPISLEELSSTKNNDFIAKALVTNLFGVGRRLGVGYGRDAGSWGYQVSAFGRELTEGLAHGSGFAARGHFAPINTTGHLLHLGLAVADYDTDADTLRLRARPGADLATARLIDTGPLRNTDRQRTIGVETLWVHGPLKLQGEYMRTRVARYASGSQPGADFIGDSGYVSGVWNIGGETWGYKAGVPGTPSPQASAGLWQLGLRHDHADLDHGPVRGGEESNWTLGANWYWRANLKLSANYVKVDSRRFVSPAIGLRSDDPAIAEVRAQLHW